MIVSECYFCSHAFAPDRPRVPGVSTPICKPCWTHVRDDDSAVVEFDDNAVTPTTSKWPWVYSEGE